MPQRDVLNRYYPSDQAQNRHLPVRLVAPFYMRCKTCGGSIYKGSKLGARKEDVENESYLGIQIYRFYFKCPCCLSEMILKTHPQSKSYVAEAGIF